jgi:hypothetical protein
MAGVKWYEKEKNGLQIMNTCNGGDIRSFLKQVSLLLISIILFSIAGRACDEGVQCHHCSIQISGPLKFILPGSPGEFREEDPVIISLSKGSYCIQFSAEKFLYTGNSSTEKYSLDAIYWIDKFQNRFSTGFPLILYTDATKTNGNHDDCFKLRLYGKVTISRVSAQPAGKYEGRITVTVSERP